MRTKKNRNKGGKVLDSGGFGCVFYPALKCKNRKKRPSRSVSKLMISKHAKKEYDIIRYIQSKLQVIPNYKKYFVLYNIDLCSPQKLTKKDLLFYKTKCKSLIEQDITTQNINQKLNQLKILHLPYSGTSVDRFIYKHWNTSEIYQMHTRLLDLLQNAIVPMNRLHIYHSDIKSTNILVDSDLQTRLIDWGLSVTYLPPAPLPNHWKNRPLQYNVPFSIILFTDMFKKKYTDYLNNHTVVEMDTLSQFVKKYIVEWMLERGEGHFTFISKIVNILYADSIQTVPELERKTFHVISQYITNVLVQHTKDGDLNLDSYIQHIFIHMIDIWGFIHVYYPMLDLLYVNRVSLSPSKMKLFAKLKQLYITYLYEPNHQSKPEVDDLYQDLKMIGNLFLS